MVTPDGAVKVLSLRKLVERDKQRKPLEDLSNCMVLLPPEAGGLKKGFLDGGVIFDEFQRNIYDVSDRWKDQTGNLLRRRTWDREEPPVDMRLIRTIDTRPDIDDDNQDDESKSIRRYWHWHIRPRFAEDDDSQTASKEQDLDLHLRLSEAFARAITAKHRLSEPEAMAVILAARWHDIGKARRIWQKSIGNLDYPEKVLAKSGGKMHPAGLCNFRHEFGSLLDIMSIHEFQELEPSIKDLVVHLIAAHHGRARPHFPLAEAFDHNHLDIKSEEIACVVPHRFGRLQRKYGRWGLAYLESLVRASDALASKSYNTEKIAKSAGFLL